MLYVKHRDQTKPTQTKAADVMPPLEDGSPLEAIARQVAPHDYARATAREFALGQYSGRRRKPRYAMT